MLTLLVAIVSLSTAAADYDFNADGVYYKIWSKSKHTCFVVAGDKKYTGDVVIPSTVNYNGIPFNVTEIDQEAFFECQGLKSVVINEGVTSIAGSAFNHDDALESIVFPESLKSIGDRVFYNCVSLRSIKLPGKLESIGLYAFEHCTGLTSVEIPNSVTSVGLGAFYECFGLKSVCIGNMTSLGYHAFFRCNNLTEATIGNNDVMQYFLGHDVDVTTLTLAEDYTDEILASTATDLDDGSTDYVNLKKNLAKIILKTKKQISWSGEESNISEEQYKNISVIVPAENLSWYQTAAVWRNFANLKSTTGINKLTTDACKPYTIYDLQGRKLKTRKHGINIINGKKLITR